MPQNKAFNLIKKIRPYNIKKGFRYLKHFGLKEFMVRLSERVEPDDVPYGPWFEAHKATADELERQRKYKWKSKVLISIAVPVYRTKKEHLSAMIESLIVQSYPYWELCIANASPDDRDVKECLEKYCLNEKRICVKELKENLGIAPNTNEAILMASGEYVGFLDHDDVLAPNALFEVAKAIEDRQPDIIYTDEDKVDETGVEHTQPNFKPDFSIDLLRSNNYICHFLVIRKTLLDLVGGFSDGFNGAQDHDLLFRCTEKAKGISHIPKVLYHWRTHAASTSDNPASKLYAYESGVRAIEEHLKRSGVLANVSMLKDYGFYRVDYAVAGNPLVSIIIPNKDNAETLKRCISSIVNRSTYDNFEIIIVENNSTEKETFDYYNELQKHFRIKVVTWEKEFNYSAINNYAVSFSKGEYLLFLNNDIEIRTPEWIEGLLGNVQRREVGVCGCKLYYPDGTIQHAGTIIGIRGIAGHAFTGMDGRRSGYMHKASIQLNYSAVTAACMMVKKAAFDEVGGFEEKLTVAFNDVDLCLKIGEAGYLVVYNPFVEMIHYESKTRGAEDTKEKVRRFQEEIEYIRTRWEKMIKEGDPYYNPNLTLSKFDYSIRG